MAKTNIEIAIDLQRAKQELQVLLKDSSATADQIKKYFKSNLGGLFPDMKFPNLKDPLEKGIVAPSGNARMAIAGVSQAMNDAQMFQQSFRMGMMSIGNNVDMVVQSLVNLSAESKRNGTTMGRELWSVIKGPSGILLGISLLITALTVLPTLFDKTGDAADKAADGGMKKYAERLSDLGTADIVDISKRTEALKKKIREDQEKLFTFVVPAGGGMATKVFQSKEAEAQYDALQKQFDILNKFTSKNKDAIIEANELQAVLGLAGGVLGIRPYDKQKRDAEIAAMKEGVEKEKRIADQKLKDDEARITKEVANEKARDSIIQDLRKAHLSKINEIEKPLRDAETLQSGKSLSEQFKLLGMSGADLDRVMKYDRSSAENQLAELERMKSLVAGSDLSGDKKFSVNKDIENEIERVKRKKIESEIELQQLKAGLILDEEEREIESIWIRYNERIQTATLENESREKINALRDARDAEIERTQAEFTKKKNDEAKRAADEEKRLQKEISDLSIYRTEDELQVKLNSIHKEYEEKRQRIEEIRKLNKISADEELELLNGLKKAEGRDRADVTKRYHETIRNEWKETHQAGMIAINSMNAGVRQMWSQWIVGGRQARDEMDAVWLAIRNTALNSLGEIVAKYIETEIITKAIGASASAATVAEMTAITAAATPAALAVNIATVGAAGAAAAATFGVASSALAASMAAVKIVAAEKGALIDREQFVLAGEGGKKELIAPVTNFEQFAHRELLPSVLAMVARDGINTEGFAERSQALNGSSSSTLTMRKMEKGLSAIHKAIKGLNLSAEISDSKLLWIVKNRERIEKYLHIE